ncbi:hypothetical protein ACUNWD_12860 [Sunxiuqinia sp. A32]|uniref:hypothetical protein n=1 Tax=Sunxiuqinia sp. A32 TaxID=3461496 RepID=UPI004045B02C
MKTQNNKQANRNNQIQKVLLRSAAVIISFVLISFTVSAQGFWKQLLTNNSFGKMAMLMVEESEADLYAQSSDAAAEVPSKSESTAFYFEQSTDKALELENWMTDDYYFGAYNEMLEPVSEPALELEDWMKSDSHFKTTSNNVSDKELNLEAWMVNDEYWGS